MGYLGCLGLFGVSLLASSVWSIKWNVWRSLGIEKNHKKQSEIRCDQMRSGETWLEITGFSTSEQTTKYLLSYMIKTVSCGSEHVLTPRIPSCHLSSQMNISLNRLWSLGHRRTVAALALLIFLSKELCSFPPYQYPFLKLVANIESVTISDRLNLVCACLSRANDLVNSRGSSDSKERTWCQGVFFWEKAAVVRKNSRCSQEMENRRSNIDKEFRARCQQNLTARVFSLRATLRPAGCLCRIKE